MKRPVVRLMAMTFIKWGSRDNDQPGLAIIKESYAAPGRVHRIPPQKHTSVSKADEWTKDN